VEDIMSNTKWLLSIVALLATTGSVFAQGAKGAQEAPQWTYVEGGFSSFNPGNGSADSGGFVGGSMGIFKSFHLIGQYDWNGDYSIWEVGGGWHGLFGESLDMFAQATWQDVAFDSGLNDSSDSGARIAGGVRWILGKRFEIKGTASWVDVVDSDVTFKAEGLWFLMQNRLGLGVSWEIGNSDTGHVFARWNFGQ
jgi:hypothetical protein